MLSPPVAKVLQLQQPLPKKIPRLPTNCIEDRFEVGLWSWWRRKASHSKHCLPEGILAFWRQPTFKCKKAGAQWGTKLNNTVQVQVPLKTFINQPKIIPYNTKCNLFIKIMEIFSSQIFNSILCKETTVWV